MDVVLEDGGDLRRVCISDESSGSIDAVCFVRFVSSVGCIAATYVVLVGVMVSNCSVACDVVGWKRGSLTVGK